MLWRQVCRSDCNQRRQHTHCLTGTQEQFRPIAVLQPLFTDLSDTAANEPGTAVVACLPDFAAYINDDGQGRTAAFVSLHIMLNGSAPKGKF